MAGGGLGVAGRRRWKLHGATGLGWLGGMGQSREGSSVGCPERAAMPENQSVPFQLELKN